MGKYHNQYCDLKVKLAGRKARNNGSEFESLIDRALLRYKALRIAYIEKTPEPMRPLSRPDARGHFTAIYTKSAQPDYKGTLKGGRSIVFEAKHTEAPRIEKDRVSEEQAEALSRHERLGAICFVLVSFRFENFYAVPWEVWRNIEQKFGKKSLNENDLLPYTVPGIMSFLDNVLTREIIKETGLSPIQIINAGVTGSGGAAEV